MAMKILISWSRRWSKLDYKHFGNYLTENKMQTS